MENPWMVVFTLRTLWIQFFVRSNRGVEFTPDGREFLGYAASLLEQKQWIETRYGEARNAAPATEKKSAPRGRKKTSSAAQ